MDTENHIVTGIYASRAEAESAREELIVRGFPPPRLKVVERARADDSTPALADDDNVLKEVLVDGTLGTLVGAGLGAVAQVALVAANVTLFIASPLLAPLTMIGWGASLGALVGGAAGANSGAKQHQGKFADLVRFAIRSGHVTLIAETRTEKEKALAAEIIGASLTAHDTQHASPAKAAGAQGSTAGGEQKDRRHRDEAEGG